MKKVEIIKDFFNKLEKLGFKRNNDLEILKEELLNKENLLENLKKSSLDQRIEDLNRQGERIICFKGKNK